MICPPSMSRWVLVGDSYAVGLAPTLIQQAAGCGIDLVVHAEEGTHIGQWAEWIGPVLSAERPDFVLVSQGGNDFGRTWAAEQVKTDIGRFQEQIESSGARMLWISPPTTPFSDAIGARQMWWDRAGEDGFDSAELDIPRASSDPLGHPTGPGYAGWARQVWPWAASRALSEAPSEPAEPRPKPGTQPPSRRLSWRDGAWMLAGAIGGYAIVRLMKR